MPPGGPDAASDITADPGPGLLEEVGGLVTAATDADGSPPLNEAGLLALAHPGRGGVRHLVATGEGVAVGYAQLAADGTGQVVVAPSARRRGVGRALVGDLLDAAAEQDVALQVWAFGDSSAARALARRTGLVAERSLLIMRRSLVDLPEPSVPDGFVITTFRVGRDEQAWLSVNARAFAHHPEQGSIDAEDLAERLTEAWFDPSGFFLARASHDTEDQPDGPVLGFHWTKEHGGRLGEVYVLGVDPDAQGRGLAKALLLTGLAHLRDGGDEEVELYVEADQEGPVGLYRSYGFAESSRDVMYAGPPPATR